MDDREQEHRRADVERVLAPILIRWRNDPTALVQILREAQESLHWISPPVIEHLGRALSLPHAKIEGVAGFYSFFHTRPCGRYRVRFADNIIEHMQGGPDLLDRMCRSLWVERGKVSEDGLVSVDTTSCIGMGDQGPALLVNNLTVTNLDEARIDQLCELIRKEVPLAEWPQELFAVADNVRHSGPLLDTALRPGDALSAARGHIDRTGTEASNTRSWREGLPGDVAGPASLIDELRRSGLRGRGGAGFATALKWDACRNAPVPEGGCRVIVCNADEGEPGTFKDRVLLNSHADLVFEGMTVAALAVGARRGFLYLRGEYRYLLEKLEGVLARRRADGLLGPSVLGIAGADFDIEIHLGAGAYVCGEESALIESLEGKRGTPRNRPPFPVTNGYLDQPTVVNNVETFACAALIAYRGGDWFAGLGTAESSGTKLLSVSGDVERPGVYEFPFGVTIGEVLEAAGARDAQAVQVGGPSGTCVGEAEFGRRIAFEDVPSAGAFMVFDRSRDMFEVARNFTHFFAHESCGFCTPCRVGTSLLRNLMDKLKNGHGSPYDFAEIEKMNHILQQMSHCGLGHSACNPVLDTIARFRPAYERRLSNRNFEPAFDLDRALAPARQMTGRDDAGAHLAIHGGEAK
ncbi:MAG: NAD(P)H-dependent oxidoreductase subunit E [Azospira sp.]|jgi:[NiFe] hydrogenase diaphorase moiety large subunit|nr:NAD(P)H-dependent oxidoreductase subunit E [Azospira sp.]